ncbi:U-box domain-containing protein 26 [Linum perenne]
MPGSLEPLDLTIQIPYHFRCPISLELMRDPVTVSTGQTYDRSSIESWIATGVDESIIHEALAVVAMFPISEAEAVRVASDSEKVRCLVELLLHSSIEARVNSAAVIEMVVVGTRSSDLRAQISSVDEIHEGVVEMLRNPIPYIGSAKD